MRKAILLTLFITTHLLCHAQGGIWTWVKGSDTLNGPGNIGTIGVTNSANYPDGRYSAAQWTDLIGNFWIFGGVSSAGERNDLWKYSPTANTWTWVNGPITQGGAGVYGTKGIPGPNNIPGARSWGGRTWTDQQGRLWLNGGMGHDVNGVGGVFLNDLWMYDITTNEWTWMAGTDTVGTAPQYGTLQVPAIGNTPGGRSECNTAWVKFDGTLWTFGGENNRFGLYDDLWNDMWMFDINTNMWTWMSGDSTSNKTGNFGTLNVEAASNLPSSRFSYTHWQDANDNFYIFSGCGYVSSGSGVYSDVWKYNTSNNRWTWIGGDTTPNSTGLYLQTCIPGSGIKPGGRYENRTAQMNACTDIFWTFGGQDINYNTFNDLWVFNAQTDQWTWVSGDSTVNSTGNYGTIGQPSATNLPPSRTGECMWVDGSGVIWIWGGSPFSYEYHSDMWKFVPDTSCLPSSKCENGISETTEPSGIRLYPNPNNGSFILDAPQAIGSTYTIYDMLGRLIQQDIISAESIPISMSGSAAGAYALVVHTAAASGTIRFTVLK